MKVVVPEPSLILLVGASGSGKSTFARKHFKPTEVLSSDQARGLVSDDETDQSATTDAFVILRLIAGRRLARGRLTVVDATNVHPQSRKSLVALARARGCMAVAIVLDVTEAECEARNQGRPDRLLEAEVIRLQARQLRRSLPDLHNEGFGKVYVFGSVADVDSVEIVRQPSQLSLPGVSEPR